MHLWSTQIAKRAATAALLIVAGSLTFCASAQEAASYRDPRLPVEERVADLLSKMTLEEKVAQMICIWDDKAKFLNEAGEFDTELARKIMPLSVGQIARPSDRKGEGEVGFVPGRGPRETAEFTNAIQRFAIEETRLGIPVMFHEEGLHGYKARGATHFPQAIAMASTWDAELVERVNRVIAREIAARGVRQVLSPVVDVARDPRWGRCEETFGEDPYLVSEMGLAAVRGLQGNDLPLAEDHVFATLKHMTGHGEPENGTNVGPANISERVLREAFFSPFRRAVAEAHVMSVMASYNEIDGVPSHASRWLLGDVLRGEWGFSGYVVSDYSAIKELHTRHSVAGSLDDAAALAVAAGVDIELPKPEAYTNLAELVRAGVIEEAAIDQAVGRLLRGKFLAGLFDWPYVDADAAEAATDTEEARLLAAEAARKAIVLLKNDDGLLPLSVAKVKRLAVIGPNAAETLLGTYSDEPTYSISVLEGIRKKVGDRVDVEYAEGCRITEGRNLYTHQVTPADPEQNRQRIAEAVKLARASDHVLLVVGGNEHTSREGYAENHLGDRSSVVMFGQQNELVRAVLATGVPTVVVLINGQPLAVVEIARDAPAVLEGWYLGQETGTAVADVLFGDANPGGKLPISLPRSVGQLPVFYNYKPTARRGYLFSKTEPLYPFGFGLSYTTFKFANLRLSASKIGPGDSCDVSVDVTNTGQRAGDEVVQLYVRDAVSSVTRPVKELKAFRRLTLAPGATDTVTFATGPEQLAFFDHRMQWVVEPGEFQIMVGPNSVDLETLDLTVTP